jgi:transcriptional regulator with XRE-family HTH domain
VCYTAFMQPLLDQLVRAIEESGQTRYQIAKGSGVAQSQLSRLVHGENEMSVSNIERIAEYLGLEITLRPKRARKGK